MDFSNESLLLDSTMPSGISIMPATTGIGLFQKTKPHSFEHTKRSLESITLNSKRAAQSGQNFMGSMLSESTCRGNN